VAGGGGGWDVEVFGGGSAREIPGGAVVEDEAALARFFAAEFRIAFDDDGLRSRARADAADIGVVFAVLDFGVSLRAGIALGGVGLERDIAVGDGLALEGDKAGDPDALGTALATAGDEK